MIIEAVEKPQEMSVIPKGLLTCRTVNTPEILSSNTIPFTTIHTVSTYKTWPHLRSPGFSSPNLKQCLHSPGRPLNFSRVEISVHSWAQEYKDWQDDSLSPIVLCDLHSPKRERVDAIREACLSGTYPQLRQDLSSWSALWQFLFWRDQTLSSTLVPPRSQNSHPPGILWCRSRRRDLGTMTEERVKEMRNSTQKDSVQSTLRTGYLNPACNCRVGSLMASILCQIFCNYKRTEDHFWICSTVILDLKSTF